MADSMYDIRYVGWSKFSNHAFGEIAMCMDTTSTVRLTTCSKELCCQVAGGKGCICPNDGCRTLVTFHDFLNHKMAFPHGPCNCTEPSYEFTTPPKMLLAHLEKSHSLEMHSFHYDEEHMYISQPLLAPSSWRVETIVSGDDGMVFAMRFDMLDYGLVVSIQCIRLAACLFLGYMVELHFSKPSMIGEDMEEFAEDSLFFEMKRSTSLDTVRITKDFSEFSD